MAYCGEEIVSRDDVKETVTVIAGVIGLLSAIPALVTLGRIIYLAPDEPRAVFMISAFIASICLAILIRLHCWPKKASGNRAFDRHQEEEYERLEYEKEVFIAFMRNVKNDEDKAIFDKFMKTQ